MTVQADKIEALQRLCGGTLRTRFAPSPTGYLHLGHAYSALCAWHAVGESAEYFHLRIDDLDETRCGTVSPGRFFRLALAGHRLARTSFLSVKAPCPLCHETGDAGKTGAGLSMLSQPEEAGSLLSAPHLSAEGIAPAPSTRHLLDSDESRQRAASGMPLSGGWIASVPLPACPAIPPFLARSHRHKHSVHPAEFGDVVLGRRDSPASYHLSTVIDDADSAITLVVRGADLAPVTQIHRLLQAVLGLPSPLLLASPACDR